MHEYDQIVSWHAANRGDSVGVAEVEAFVRPLRRGSRVLDVGCGTGAPVTRLMVGRGLEVCGIDSSARMMAAFRANFPGLAAQYASV